jgi:excisionase family DNA binding protein
VAERRQQMNTATREYLTAGQVAERFKVSVKTVNRWANEGKLPFARTLGGHRRYPTDGIDRLAGQLEDEGGFRTA